MNICDLIDYLQDVVDNHPNGDHLEVRIATQPSYPLAFGLHNAIVLPAEGSRPEALWLVATQGHPYNEPPYAPAEAWHEDQGRW